MVEYQEEIFIKENIQPRPLSSRRRTGRAFHVDDFENYYSVITEKWVESDATIALNTDYSKEGAACMKLTTGTAADEAAVALKILGVFPIGRFGLELDFMTFESLTNIKHVLISIIYTDLINNKLWYGNIKYLAEANLKWQYLDDTIGDYADISGGSYTLPRHDSRPYWNNLKIIADFENAVYGNFYINEKTFDLSAHTLESDTADGVSELIISISIENAVATATRSLYIDNVILTDQEP